MRPGRFVGSTWAFAIPEQDKLGRRRVFSMGKSAIDHTIHRDFSRCESLPGRLG